MNTLEDAQSSLDEIARRRQQAVDGAARGRHRGWDAAGLAAGLAGFAAMDLPLSETPRLILFAVGTVTALACFTRAGQRGRALVHRSQLTGRHLVLFGGLAVGAGALAFGGTQLLDWLDPPMRHTILGGVLALLLVPAEWAYRAFLRRITA